jgi:hypothetical protein
MMKGKEVRVLIVKTFIPANRQGERVIPLAFKNLDIDWDKNEAPEEESSEHEQYGK